MYKKTPINYKAIEKWASTYMYKYIVQNNT